MAEPILINEILKIFRLCPPDRYQIDFDEVVPVNTLGGFAANLRIIGNILFDQSRWLWFERTRHVPYTEKYWVNKYWTNRLLPRLDEYFFKWEIPNGADPYRVTPQLNLYRLVKEDEVFTAYVTDIAEIVKELGTFTLPAKPDYCVTIKRVECSAPLAPE